MKSKKRQIVQPNQPTKKAPASEAAQLAEIAEQLTRTMEKTRIAEYVDYLHHPGRLLWMNFLIGIARGLGSTIGLAIVLGITVYVVQKLITLNLPLISDWITDFIIMIEKNYDMLRTRGQF